MKGLKYSGIWKEGVYTNSIFTNWININQLFELEYIRSKAWLDKVYVFHWG